MTSFEITAAADGNLVGVVLSVPECGPGDGLLCACGEADTREHHNLKPTPPVPTCSVDDLCGSTCCASCSVMCRGYHCDSCSSTAFFYEKGVPVGGVRCAKAECRGALAGTIGDEVYCVGCGDRVPASVAWIVRNLAPREATA